MTSRFDTVEIVGNEMVLMDADGNGCDCHTLQSSRDAKRQLRRWQDSYTYRYANALKMLLNHFTI